MRFNWIESFFKCFIPILRLISQFYSIITIIVHLLFCCHFSQYFCYDHLEMHYWFLISNLNLWWQLIEFICFFFLLKVSKFLEINRSLLPILISIHWLAVEYIESNKFFLLMQKNFFDIQFKNYDREGESLPIMIVTFSSCNGFLWTDFLKISFAHIGFVLKMCVSKGTRAYLHRKRKNNKKKKQKKKKKNKIKHTKIGLVFAWDMHTHTQYTVKPKNMNFHLETRQESHMWIYGVCSCIQNVNMIIPLHTTHYADSLKKDEKNIRV